MGRPKTLSLSHARRLLFDSTARGLLSGLLSARAQRYRYQVGRRFHRAIRRHLSGLERYPMYPVWSEFAFSTNLRGKEVAGKLLRYSEIRGKRYLDIGCAYGGYPIAFAARGAESVGIDINGRFLELAAENVRDQKASVLLLERDVTKSDQISDLGLFDIITCNDLIEHVEDVAKTFTNISSLLRPGGLLFMEIPNAWSVGQALKDGHYGLFGITLLSRPDAIRYFRESGYNDEYGVGYFQRLEGYMALLEENGIRLHGGEIINSYDQLDERVQRVRVALPAIRADLEAHLGREVLSSQTKEALSWAVEELLGQASGRVGAYNDAQDERLRDRLGRDLIRCHEMEFWELIGFKQVEPAS